MARGVGLRRCPRMLMSLPRFPKVMNEVMDHREPQSHFSRKLRKDLGSPQNWIPLGEAENMAFGETSLVSGTAMVCG